MSGAGHLVAEPWPPQRSAEKAQSAASQPYVARRKVHRFVIMFVLGSRLISISRKVARPPLD